MITIYLMQQNSGIETIGETKVLSKIVTLDFLHILSWTFLIYAVKHTFDPNGIDFNIWLNLLFLFCLAYTLIIAPYTYFVFGRDIQKKFDEKE